MEMTWNWLVMGLEWPAAPGTDVAEAVLAILPPVCPEYPHKPKAGPAATGAEHREVGGLLRVWEEATAERSERVTFLSDLTDFLERQGRSWQAIEVDWQAAVAELTRRARGDRMPGVFLKVSRLAHGLLCHTPASNLVLSTESGPQVLYTSQREQVRLAIAGALQDYLNQSIYKFSK